jgi:outer membrane protein TolC
MNKHSIRPIPSIFVAATLIVLPLFFLVPLHAGAQSGRPPTPSQKQAATTPAPAPAPRLIIVDTIDGYRYYDTTEVKLVRLALDGPLYHAALSQNKVNELQLKGAKNQILNLLTLSLNYNDQTFAKPTAQNSTAYVYPKYFLGFNIPLGAVFSRTQVKAAREQIKISHENQVELARTIRSEVLSRYRQYKIKSQLVSLQTQVVDDEQTAFIQVQRKFTDGTVTLEIHNTAQKRYNDEVTKKLQLQLELDNLRLELEKFIGTNLENVLN